MATPAKKKRIRASELLKKCRVGEEKYYFSKIVDLKGGCGRDATKKGRPPGITSGMHSKTAVKHVALTLPDALPCETETGKFLFTTRRGMAFNEDMHWIYKCTCDVTRSELIECCGDRMHVPYSDFMRRVPGCIHISTLTTILDHFDAVNQIFQTLSTDDNQEDTNECDTYADKILEVRKGLFCIITENCHGIVDVTKETKCLTCRSTLKVKCIHLQKFSSYYEELCQASGSTRPSSYEPKCLSERKIQFNSSTLMQAEYKRTLKERFKCVSFLQMWFDHVGNDLA